MTQKKTLLATDKHVGARLRMRRIMLGLTQAKLAGMLGLTFQQVQKYEKGANRIAASRLLQLAAILNVTIPFFFEGAPPVASNATHDAIEALSPTIVHDFLSTADGLSLTRAFMRIKNAKLRRRIVELVEQIADK